MGSPIRGLLLTVLDHGDKGYVFLHRPIDVTVEGASKDVLLVHDGSFHRVSSHYTLCRTCDEKIRGRVRAPY